jgi:hypothetical protein
MINTSLPQAFDLESQKQLARLLAKENIHIRVGNYKTAFFEPVSRVLGLPSWNVADKNVADLLVGHEVGHALFTPVHGIAEFQQRFPNAPFDVCNIVEDIRIERMILDSYPGLITPFRNGYSYFLEKDFFSIANRNVHQMDFLDRLNLKGKLRDLIDIDFSAAELAIYKRCLLAETWQDVLEICAEILKMKKESSTNQSQSSQSDQEPNAPKTPSNERSQSEGDDDSFDPMSQQFEKESESQSEGESKSKSEAESKSESEAEDKVDATDKAKTDSSADDADKTDGESTDADDKESTSESEEQSDDQSDAKQNGVDAQNDSNTGDTSNFKSETQRAFDSSLNDLHADCDFSTINTPIKADFEKCIVNIDTFRQGRKKHLSRYNDMMTSVEYHESWLSFKASSKTVVASYSREFERKKSAFQYSRATQATTGRINVNKLHAYRYDDQIFKSITNLADAKSHGMVFFLDYSQSMCGVIGPVVKQLLQLAFFCKSVNIPFVVYSFTNPFNSYDPNRLPIPRPGENIDFRYASVCEILNSNLNKNEFETACKELYINAVCAPYNRGFHSEYECMSGTPLLETIIIGAHLVREFQEKTRVQKVNTIFLTDGDGGPLSLNDSDVDTAFVKRDSHSYGAKNWKWNKNTYAFHKRESYVSNYTALIRDFKNITRSNVICFFVPTGGKKDIIGKCANAYITSDAYPLIKEWKQGYDIYESQIKKNKAEKYVFIEGGFGFDGYFIMKNTQNMQLEDDKEFIAPSNANLDSTAGRRNFAKAFTSHTVSKNDSRVFLNKFFDLIA